MRLLVILPCCWLWLASSQAQQQQQQWTYRGSRQPAVYATGAYNRLPSVYDPLEVVDFELMPLAPAATTTARGAVAAGRGAYKNSNYNNNNNNGRNFAGRHKYELLVEQPQPAVTSSAAAARSRSRRLPLLSRGERDLDEDEEDDYLLDDEGVEDEDEVPSCQELRRMWRIARRIHNRAIKTNKIPQETGHPFADFESDR